MIQTNERLAAIRARAGKWKAINRECNLATIGTLAHHTATIERTKYEHIVLSNYAPDLRYLLDLVQQQADRIDALEEALNFYADKNNYDESGMIYHLRPYGRLPDEGIVARRALWGGDEPTP